MKTNGSSGIKAQSSAELTVLSLFKQELHFSQFVGIVMKIKSGRYENIITFKPKHLIVISKHVKLSK